MAELSDCLIGLELDDSKFIDDCWLLIFEHLSLNERRNVRLTCKRFRSICDQIKIDKLVIFERQAPLPGRLQQTNEPFGLEHTAYVVHLSNLFADKRIVEQMRPIRALAIHGDYGTSVDLEAKFEQLNYLELHGCMFRSPILLSSTSLEYIIFDFAYLRPEELVHAKAQEIRRGYSGDLWAWAWFALGLEEFRSRHLKYFSVVDELDTKLLMKAIASRFFDHLEEADLYLLDWTPIQLLAQKKFCPKLRKLNVMIGSGSVKPIVDRIGQQDLSEFFSSFGEHLTVHLLGFPFNRQHKTAMVEFFQGFGRMIQVSKMFKCRFQVQIYPDVYEHMKKWNKKRNLDQFYQMVSKIMLIVCDQLASDKQFFKRFSQCSEIEYLSNPSPADFDGHLDALVNLKRVLLLGSINHPVNGNNVIDNRLLDSIAEKCQQLEALWFNSCEQIDFSFLFKLQRLSSLGMHLAFPPPPCMLIDLLKNCKNLADLEVCFIRSHSESKSELSATKKLVNETFSARFKARKLEFRVEIHTNVDQVDQFVRCVLKKDHQPIEMRKWSETSMFELIEHTKALMGEEAFDKQFAQPAISDKC